MKGKLKSKKERKYLEGLQKYKDDELKYAALKIINVARVTVELRDDKNFTSALYEAKLIVDGMIGREMEKWNQLQREK